MAAYSGLDTTLAAGTGQRALDRSLPIWVLLGPPGIVILLAALNIIYIQRYALSTGLDSTSAQFGRYWYSLMAVEILVVFPAVIFWLRRLATTRCEDCAAERLSFGSVSPGHELRHIWTHFGIIAAAGTSGFVLPGIFAYYDGSWHQAVLRDSSLSPTHIPLFFCFGPMMVALVLGAYIYERTRLPHLSESSASIPLAYQFAGGAWVVVALFFGLNEFGHIEWIAEERLANPIHLGFVLPFWCGLATLAVVLRSLPRLFALATELRGAGSRTALPTGADRTSVESRYVEGVI